MCQISAVVERDGKMELVKENVVRLEVRTEGVTISTLFEGPTLLSGLTVDHIDFLAGKVFLQKH